MDPECQGSPGNLERPEERTADARAESIGPLLPRFAADGAWLGPGAPAPPPELLARVPARVVRACIDRLPELYRVALLLRDVEGLSVAEAAAAIGVPEKALAMRHHRARQALLTLLRAHLAARTH